ncbi:hypothetical protein P7C70_g9475, partial [Phenoliferia sp. Uapishka_3]
MTMIVDFPPECLLRIFHFLSNETTDTSLWRTPGWEQQYYQCQSDIASICLVSVQWRSLAQPMLWKLVYITDEGLQNQANTVAKSILASPVLGRFRTTEVFFQGSEIRPKLWKRLMEGLVGIQRLRMLQEDAPVKMDEEWLGLSTLKELRFLELDYHFNPSSKSKVTRTHFQLNTLILGHLVDSPTVIKALITSSSETLTTLSRRRSYSSEMHQALSEVFPLLATSLETFYLDGQSPGLEKSVSSFKSLKRVWIEYYLMEDLSFIDTFVKALPTSVTTLNVHLGSYLEDDKFSSSIDTGGIRRSQALCE